MSDLRDAPTTPDPVQRDARSRLLIQGITWTAAYQIVEVGLSFASMLLLVRVLSAADYGRAAAVTGFLALLSTFGAHLCVEHALQQPDGEEPDWQLHWAAAAYVQTALAAIAHAIAAVCWFLPDYRPIALLLHVAAFGLLLEAPAQLSATMLRRELNLRRLRMVASAGMMTRLAITTALGVGGAGALAIVLGNNVFASVPFVLDLFVMRRWRPRRGWYRGVAWREYSAAAAFGLQRAGANVIGALRGAAEAAALPAPLGFAALGLINRSQALYSTTFGRVGAVVADAVYPFLPRSSGNPARYAVHATTYLRVMFLISVPAAMFVSEYGPVLSRVLYGQRWAAMDPLIRPGTYVSLALIALATAAAILMAAGRVRDCLVYEGVAAVAAMPALGVAWVTRDAAAYAWACAGVETIVAVAALWRTAPLLQRRWLQTSVIPPFVAGFAGLLFVRSFAPLLVGTRPIVELTALASVYALINLLTLRVAFAPTLDSLLAYAPAGDHLRRFARLRTAPAISTGLPES